MRQLNWEDSGDEQITYDEVEITPQILRDAISRLSSSADSPGIDYDFDTTFQDAGMESLQVAELIVELEEALGKQLDLVDIDRFETLGDLCRALRATGELL
jgi:acyl carrier protein